MEQAVYVFSERGGKLLLYHGYLYRISKRTQEAQYYKCSKGCRATIIVQDELIKGHSGKHSNTHISDDNTVIGKQAVVTFKKSVKSSPFVSIPKVYKETMLSLSVEDASASSFPNFRSIQATMYRQRLNEYPKLPKTLSEMVLPPELKLTISEKNFLLCDDGLNNSRMLIFSTTENLKILCESSEVFADGTFKIAPSIFLQLYTLHARFMGELVPVVYALLPNKETTTYVNMLRNIKTACTAHGLQFSPEVMKTDFELAVFAAVRLVLPQTRSSGCLFHFCQAIWRKVQFLGLTANFKEDNEVNRCIKRLFGLALVPQENVADLFQVIVETAPPLSQITQLMDYVFENFIGDPVMGITARFEGKIWNHFDDMNNATNNKLEGWHFSMNQRFSGKHPNIFRFITELKKEQDFQEKRCHLLLAGQHTERKVKKWVQLQNRRQAIKAQFLKGERNLLQYLDAIKHVLHFE